MFDSVRNNKRLVQLFLALITLPFAFWGVESYVRNTGDSDEVASVGGSKISQQELQRALSEQEERMRASLGRNYNPGMFDSPEVRRAVLESLANQRMLLLHASKSGLAPSDAALGQIIQSVPAFAENGKFSRERYDAYVATQGLSQPEFEARLRQDIKLQQLMAAVRDGSVSAHLAEDRWVATLQEGRECPAVSLYLTLDETTLEIKGSETRIERVLIGANLRHDQLDAIVTTEWLEDAAFQHRDDPQVLQHKRPQLAFLYRLAKHQKLVREVVRGKPETFNRPDYNFRLVGNEGREPQGTETVQISIRQRGAPLDLIVSEAMILANSTWGNWLAELGVPAIYRSQASLLPGVKVRMGTKALPHAGIGVKSYAWSTSPLRRYTDLVNQWQIIACARHGKTAALAAPFKPKDADLFAIISSFDAAYSGYNAYQGAMERFWTLKYLQQNGINEIQATVFKENMVRADDLPLVLLVSGASGMPRGACVRVRLGDIDEVSLDVSGTVLARLDSLRETVQGAPDSGADEEEDEGAVAGPIAIALDLQEGDSEAGAPVGVVPAS